MTSVGVIVLKPSMLWRMVMMEAYLSWDIAKMNFLTTSVSLTLVKPIALSSLTIRFKLEYKKKFNQLEGRSPLGIEIRRCTRI